MRKTSLQCVRALAEKDARVCFVGSDLGAGVMDDFCAAFPQRMFREGISEQHIVGMAAGLALEGHVVYVNTIASFLTKRCFEQIYLDLCMNRAKVRLLGSGGGLVYAPLGPTHLAVEDVALLRPLPHMHIIAPCDAREMAALLPLTLDVDGPVYVRMAKGGEPLVSPVDEHYELGRAVCFAEGKDALFVTTGITVHLALEARELLRQEGIDAGILHCHTLKPLDTERIIAMARNVNCVVPMEEHVRTGGLSEATAMVLYTAGLPRMPRCLPLALPDAFFSEHGSQKDILAAHGLTAQRAAELVKEGLR